MANCENCIKSDVCKYYEPKSTVACERYSEPVRHGHWICENLGFSTYRYRCSECGNIYGQDQIEEFKHSKFCGDCGAKMDGNKVE